MFKYFIYKSKPQSKIAIYGIIIDIKGKFMTFSFCIKGKIVYYNLLQYSSANII